MASPGELRERVWARLMKERAVAYPLPPHGHHPNFRGAGEAAELLLAYTLEHGLVGEGDTVLSYPDYVLKPLRQRFLQASVAVVVPDKHGRGFRLLEPGRVNAARASSIAGAEREGEGIGSLPDLKLAFLACVGLGLRGEILDKGYGFKLPPEARKLPKLTLIHPLQVLEERFQAEFTALIWATPEEVRRSDAPST